MVAFDQNVYCNFDASATKAIVCIKVINGKTKKGMFGGLASVSDYSLEAPYDDGMTYSISLEGNGALIDLSTLSSEDAGKVTAMPS
ncbi:TPA: phage major tail protein, TP901-1 family [Streptococcus pyogenes]|uniref:Phage major tail protein, TP901-1 family n=1 Tax=Streptococcus pyogenes TaxID=1314 RepID=A0A660A4H4_STRPY|nr:phage major tail protein, TP901-1 family [Streptococcus pyogenes]HER4526484.1 phage major tail protein, TP901-1 family [Streptococcus pyogenes NGAS758]HER4529816.1 phage major tail protein, TP901-1 family [Streptococcus pyogenes NGAS746]HER4531529.1 phage major tail protein, TP901-1 family [Streptococcus pyogenes NGAS759]HER4534793.1 phage major tail protein, TP901-1 family [Streptococcus pyogenes NGAS737]HER4646676.1 phage major tail protein, TP901-1 family [Streptococcus pyogenes NGAS493]